MLDVVVFAEGRNSGAIEFTFPRWVPGSYLMREPFRYVREISVEDENGNPLKWKRNGINGITISARSPSKCVSVSYQVICPELSVRSNHVDNTHMHLMPPFTWFLPKSGCTWAKEGGPVTVTLNLPKSWSIATQQKKLKNKEILPNHKSWNAINGLVMHHLVAENRDELLDGIVEANPNKIHSIEVNGIPHNLKLWDAGGHKIEQSAIDRVLESIGKIANGFYELFGVPEIDDYTVILHLTGGMRGGLEHMRSQTSMVPRTALWPGEEEGWRDLVSLLSHEYVHLWNVKNLRPKKFLDYDLDSEQTTDLLWWFEGGTSWLGDVICVRSGVWSDEDYRKDFKRKLERHLNGSGHESQSLAESSYEAWIHYYRQHSYSSESQISYYNDSEIALFCLDAEMRKRSRGSGLEQVFVELYNKHGLHSSEAGIDESDIKLALGKCDGGARLVGFLEKLVHTRKRPDVNLAVSRFGLQLESEKNDSGDVDEGWLGLHLSERGNNLIVTKVRSDSPLRDLLIPDDEIVAIDGNRVGSNKSLGAVLKGRTGKDVDVLVSRHGSLIEMSCNVKAKPRHKTVLTGKGNQLWKSLIASK